MLTHAKKMFAAAAAALCIPGSAFAAWSWEPLIQSTYFDGIKTDMLTSVNGIVLVALIILGLGLLLKVFR